MPKHIVEYDSQKDPPFVGDFGVTICPHGKTSGNWYARLLHCNPRPKFVGSNACYECKHCEHVEVFQLICCFPHVAKKRIKARQQHLKFIRRVHKDKSKSR